MNMEFKRKLPPPRPSRICTLFRGAGPKKKQANDRQIRAILTGEDDRLLLIGPCSADREDAVLDYAVRLRTLQDRVADKLLIVPRIYSNKPRTTGDGYKGMLHQPNPNGQPDLLNGLIAIRKMHDEGAGADRLFPAQMSCCTRRITITSRTSFPTRPSAPARWRTSSTASSPAA